MSALVFPIYYMASFLAQGNQVTKFLYDPTYYRYIELSLFNIEAIYRQQHVAFNLSLQ